VKAASRTIRITRRALFAFAAAVMALFGVMFSTAAVAAGVKSIDVLAMIFLLGAAASLFALLIWYLVQLQARSRRH
jgi:RsiW-degrading membrane proteinase PrsW (M82 family)